MSETDIVTDERLAEAFAILRERVEYACGKDQGVAVRTNAPLYRALETVEAEVTRLRTALAAATEDAEPVRPPVPREILDALLAGCLKPEEIAGPDRESRARELVFWFARFQDVMANPKWLVAHAYELAYYAATSRASRVPSPQESPR